ncbi:hypothetical protein, partial [uncultured Parasutterella sp.]|uniref:hypothetical protein n=1 Tax=uncultured Parasutterella sp. TaxID=1263098 RepID=UPI00272CBD53
MVTLLSTLKADNWSSGAISDYQTITPIGAGMSYLFRHFFILFFNLRTQSQAIFGSIISGITWWGNICANISKVK